MAEKFKPGKPAAPVPETIEVGGLTYTRKPGTTSAPRGTLEVWYNDVEGWVYLGIPLDSLDGTDNHNCDAMGCNGGGLHVLARLSPLTTGSEPNWAHFRR